jgi:serine-type D-Ala-D-Ala carboxypeptidase (penicillin-binding protein 5/6)
LILISKEMDTMKQRLIALALGLSLSFSALAVTITAAATPTPAPTPTTNPMIIPPAPNINAHGYVLMDAKSGDIIAQKNMNVIMQPASLTKMMTLYITFEALKAGQIHLTGEARVSKKAWGTGGSRMFLKLGSKVPVQKLIEGIIVDSGNDACTALAQFVGGNEATFVQLMNATAKRLGMDSTHYVDPTGLPRKGHVSTPHDMAILARALSEDFPAYYHFFKQKWLSYNGIRQPNRNRLLWRSTDFDGLKTGHTKEAGYCLVASGLRNGTRLVSVVMGAPTDMARANDSQALLNYGFRFYETHLLFSANQVLSTPRIWMGEKKQVGMGLTNNLYVTIPTGSYKTLKADMSLQPKLVAPIVEGQHYGQVVVKLGKKVIATRPLTAFSSDARGGIFTRMWDHITLFFKGWFKG